MTTRVLICTGTCAEPVLVYEPQGPFTDWKTFVCGDCMEARGDIKTVDVQEEEKAA